MGQAFCVRVGLKTPISVGVKQPVAGKDVTHPGLWFFAFKGRCPASVVLWRETGDAEREARLPRPADCLCVVIYGRCLYNMNMCKNTKPQKSRFLRLTYFLTANFGDFAVCDIHMAENIVGIISSTETV